MATFLSTEDQTLSLTHGIHDLQSSKPARFFIMLYLIINACEILEWKEETHGTFLFDNGKGRNDIKNSIVHLSFTRLMSRIKVCFWVATNEASHYTWEMMLLYGKRVSYARNENNYLFKAFPSLDWSTFISENFTFFF